MSSCAIFGHSEYSYTNMYVKIEHTITQLITQWFRKWSTCCRVFLTNGVARISTFPIVNARSYLQKHLIRH